jgi:hypothetical protein
MGEHARANDHLPMHRLWWRPHGDKGPLYGNFGGRFRGWRSQLNGLRRRPIDPENPDEACVRGRQRRFRAPLNPPLPLLRSRGFSSSVARTEGGHGLGARTPKLHFGSSSKTLIVGHISRI